jgi:2-polyprenyl-6-methoxyphenol hydroxylase-like FAD-dependent oxidoreductase
MHADLIIGAGMVGSAGATALQDRDGNSAIDGSAERQTL